MILCKFYNNSIKSYHHSPSKELSNLFKVSQLTNWSDTKSIILSTDCNNMENKLVRVLFNRTDRRKAGNHCFSINILQDDGSHGDRGRSGRRLCSPISCIASLDIHNWNFLILKYYRNVPLAQTSLPTQLLNPSSIEILKLNKRNTNTKK